MKELKIERVERQGIKEIVPLFSRYMQFYEKPINEVAFQEYFDSIIDLNSVFVYLARVGGEAAGLMVIYQTLSSFELGKILFLNDLWVEEEFRKNGVGQALMKTVKDLADELGCKRVDLMTDLSNEKARALYEKNGMEADTNFINYSVWRS